MFSVPVMGMSNAAHGQIPVPVGRLIVENEYLEAMFKAGHCMVFHPSLMGNRGDVDVVEMYAVPMPAKPLIKPADTKEDDGYACTFGG